MHFSNLDRHAISSADGEAKITAWLECLSHEKRIGFESIHAVCKQVNILASVLRHDITIYCAAKHSAFCLMTKGLSLCRTCPASYYDRPLRRFEAHVILVANLAA
jgi:hypothetical protein